MVMKLIRHFDFADRDTDGAVQWKLYTEYTPAACITITTVFSQAQITYVLVAQGSSTNCSVIFLCVHKK